MTLGPAPPIQIGGRGRWVGFGAQTAEGVAEWLHYEVRRMLDIPITQGRRYSWGYPAVPDQSEHLKVDRLLEELAALG